MSHMVSLDFAGETHRHTYPMLVWVVLSKVLSSDFPLLGIKILKILKENRSSCCHFDV